MPGRGKLNGGQAGVASSQPEQVIFGRKGDGGGAFFNLPAPSPPTLHNTTDGALSPSPLSTPLSSILVPF